MRNYDERVQQTAAWLDVVEPGWVDVIDLERLDLRSFRWCVGGQIEASYHNKDHKGRYVRARYADFARRHDLVNNPDILAGFNADHPSESEELAAAWRRLIAERRFAGGAIKPELLAV